MMAFSKFGALPLIIISSVIVGIVMVADDKEAANEEEYSEQWFKRYVNENKRSDSLQEEIWQQQRKIDSLKIELKYYEQHR